ncbi:MAG: hypothetical protein D5R98_09330, partial [Desulfonatronovibrio sp. MSAO_Bac4]
HEQENEQEAGHEDSVLEQEHTVDQSHQPIEEPAEPSGQQQATFSHEGQETIPTSDDDFELPENLSVSEKQDTEEISEKEEAEKAQEETQELNQQDNQEPAKEKKDEAVDFLMALADRLEARSSQEPEQQK